MLGLSISSHALKLGACQEAPHAANLPMLMVELGSIQYLPR